MNLVSRILITFLNGAGYASILMGFVIVAIDVSDLEPRIIRSLVTLTPWMATILTIATICTFKQLGEGERIQVIIALFSYFMSYVAAMNATLANYEIAHL